MSAELEGVPIKLEQVEPSSEQNVTEIQSYLAGFQKEIGGGTSTTGDEADGEEGTYFVDQAGHYYYQAKGAAQPVLTVVPTVTQNEDGESFILNQESQDEDEAEDTDTPMTVQTDDQNQILINSGDSFQRVTVLPSDNNSGELSYVLIVQNDMKTDENQTDGDQDLAVYDFDDQEEEEPENVLSDEEDDKSKIVKIAPRKSQSVSQAHMCNYCNYTTSKRYLLSRHMKSHSEERPHKCSVCERGFKTIASLQNHVNTHTGTKPHQCKYCDAAFTTSGELVRHVRYKHTHEKPHKCHECDYASVELSKLKRHIRCHTGERPYQCPHCTYASPDTFKLKRHLRIHTGEKPYECDFCGQRFTQSNSLKAHKLIHNIGDKPIFQCDLCPTTCGRKTDLRIHVQKLHTSDKPLKCKRCGKTFPDRYSYKLHSKSHEGEKCYKCDLCPYASISARHLESHMLIHTDQKPFECEYCEQSFRQKQLLKRHQNLYHNPEYIPPPPKEKTHECPECSRAFRHKGNLIRHLAAHDPDPTIARKNMELKMGRQKRIQMIDGQAVEVALLPGEEDDEEEYDPEIDKMSVEGADGHQYVVLEVIQLADADDQAMVVNSGGDGSGEAILSETSTALHGNVLRALQQAGAIKQDDDEKKPLIDQSTEDMKNCFGFDEEEDEEDDGVQAGEIC